MANPPGSDPSKDPILFIGERAAPAFVDQQRAKQKVYGRLTGKPDGNIWEDLTVIKDELEQEDLTENQITDLYKKQTDLYDVWDEMNKAADALPGMFNADMQRTKDFAQRTGREFHGVILDGDSKQNLQTLDSLRKEIPEGTKFDFFGAGHSGRTLGGMKPGEISEILGEDVDECILGMCSADVYGPVWAEGLEKDVVGQSDNESWSGTTPSKQTKTLGEMAFYHYNEPGKQRHKVYSPK